MPIPLPTDRSIQVFHRSLPADYRMKSMEVSVDHYAIGYLIQGDRKTITPTYSYETHAGDVTFTQPYVYHRTMAQSSVPYESYLIKFAPEVVTGFSEGTTAGIFDQLLHLRISRFSKEDSTTIRQIFDEMYMEEQKEVPYKEIILKGMLYRLFCEVWEKRIHTDLKQFRTELSEPIMKAVCEIEERYGEEMRLEEVARSLGFSPSHFSRMFKAQLDLSFSSYVQEVRLRHVKDLLLNTDKSIGEIALVCGFCNGDYLSAQFRQNTGMTATQFRKGKR